MNWHYAYTSYFWPAVLMVVLLSALTDDSWHRRSVLGAPPFMIGCLFAALCAAGSVMEYAAVEVEVKIFWVMFQSVWYLPVVTTMLCFFLEYAWPGRWLTRRNLARLAVAPLLILGLILTNDFHHLLWHSFKFNGAVQPQLGLGAWLVLSYAYGLVIANLLVALAGIAPGILVLYLALMVRQDAFLQAWSSQNILPSPSPLLYLLSFGLLLPFAFAGARRYLQIDRVSGLLLVGWSLALPLLAYFPVNVQRRLPEGQWLTWSILALLAVEGWWEKPSGASRLRRIPLIAPLCLSFMATLLLFVGGLQTVLVKRSPVFLDGQEVAMFEFLAEDGEPGCLVVADFGTGNALPAWAPMRVVVGHGPESAGLATLQEQVREFYSAGTPDAWRKEWLARLAACYVFWGPAEQALGDWDPRQSSYLEVLSSLGPYSLLKVIPE